MKTLLFLNLLLFSLNAFADFVIQQTSTRQGRGEPMVMDVTHYVGEKKMATVIVPRSGNGEIPVERVQTLFDGNQFYLCFKNDKEQGRCQPDAVGGALTGISFLSQMGAKITFKSFKVKPLKEKKSLQKSIKCDYYEIEQLLGINMMGFETETTVKTKACHSKLMDTTALGKSLRKSFQGLVTKFANKKDAEAFIEYSQLGHAFESDMVSMMKVDIFGKKRTESMKETLRTTYIKKEKVDPKWFQIPKGFVIEDRKLTSKDAKKIFDDPQKLKKLLKKKRKKK